MTRWPRILILLLCAHIVLGIARLPGKVWGKRLQQIAHHRDVGAARYHLDNGYTTGADVVELLLRETPGDCVVLWRGPIAGAIEFLPALIAPRLLARENVYVDGATELWGRPLARGRVGDREGVLVVVAHPDDLELEVR